MRTILDVDVLGTVYAIEAFEKAAVRDTSLVCVASLAGQMGGHMFKMLEASCASRPGTPCEMADAVAFFTRRQARYVTSAELLVDDGQSGWIRRHMQHG
ncbi:hypothetical protein [Streptomyces griseorubiginosus]|uniref:hypothetical protein n=1 Tax=Streptomyces griseorubiginosus TaxID=67304 RepID=UPI00331AF2DC